MKCRDPTPPTCILFRNGAAPRGVIFTAVRSPDAVIIPRARRAVNHKIAGVDLTHFVIPAFAGMTVLFEAMPGQRRMSAIMRRCRVGRKEIGACAPQTTANRRRPDSRFRGNGEDGVIFARVFSLPDAGGESPAFCYNRPRVFVLAEKASDDICGDRIVHQMQIHRLRGSVSGGLLSRGAEYAGD